MGGFEDSFYETNSIFLDDFTFTLQQYDRLTNWKNNASYHTIKQARDEANLILSFNPDLRLRIVDKKLHVLWDSNDSNPLNYSDDHSNIHWQNIGGVF